MENKEFKEKFEEEYRILEKNEGKLQLQCNGKQCSRRSNVHYYMNI